jgi:OmpA-OmpF porin, OOP family
MMSRLFLLSFLALAAAAQMRPLPDLVPGPPHSLFSRYPASRLAGFAIDPYAELTLPTESWRERQSTVRNVGGRQTNHLFLLPAGTPLDKVFAHYESAAKTTGFETLYRCATTECNATHGGIYDSYLKASFASAKLARLPDISRDLGDLFPTTDKGYFLSATRTAPDSEQYIALAVFPRAFFKTIGGVVKDDQTWVWLTVLEAGAADSAPAPVIDSAGIENTLATEGHLAFYSLAFDANQAVLKPESKVQLQQIANALLSSLKSDIVIVGHTDNTGTLEFNLELSRRRAQAVTEALTNDYKIPASRLAAHGLAWLSPLASNATEAGRARNRRIEFVAR